MKNKMIILSLVLTCFGMQTHTNAKKEFLESNTIKEASRKHIQMCDLKTEEKAGTTFLLDHYLANYFYLQTTVSENWYSGRTVKTTHEKKDNEVAIHKRTEWTRYNYLENARDVGAFSTLVGLAWYAWKSLKK